MRGAGKGWGGAGARGFLLLRAWRALDEVRVRGRLPAWGLGPWAGLHFHALARLDEKSMSTTFTRSDKLGKAGSTKLCRGPLRKGSMQ